MFINLGERRNINFVANNLKIYLYNNVKENIESKDNMNISMDKDLEFVSLSEKIVNTYVRVSSLSGSCSRKVQDSVFNKADSLIMMMFSKCNQSEIDKIMDTVYEHSQDNNFKFISGVQYIAGGIWMKKKIEI